MQVVLVSIAILLLFLSLKPAFIICRQDNHIGWKILLGLISFFLLSYLYFLNHLFNDSFLDSLGYSLSLILLSGSIFVIMIVNLSLKSIKNIQQVACQEKYNSFHDSLTGLDNRKYFLITLNDKVQQLQPFSLFILDINNFKQVNDMLGYHFADQVLIKIANLIQQQISDKCFLARVEGAQFALISDAISNKDIDELLQKINCALKAPFDVNGYNLRISISCGGTQFPESSTQVTSLLQQADLAMRLAEKKQSKYIIYNKSLDNDAKYRLEISSRLHGALENEEFEVHYQPLIKTKPNQILHFEALIRWPVAEGGFIPPDKFIPIAEQSSLIRKITTLVLLNISNHLILLKQAGFNACIHINLSARDLQDNLISLQLAELVKQGKLSPQQLILEVTETAAMTDMSMTKSVLQQLSNQGFLISLDDFGTGYSSLSMLLELPIHQIKIDRSFIISMQQKKISYSIVQSIIFMAHNLKCSVVAEGVETKELVNELMDLECDFLQGYYYSKALPIDALLEYCQPTTN